jgi:hypothetical protein
VKRGNRLRTSVLADDPLLHRPAFAGAGGGRGGGLAVERQVHAAFGQDVVGGVDEVEGRAHPGVGDGLVDDLPGLDGRHPGGEGGPEHDPVLTQRASADERRELHHEPGPGAEPAALEHFVEGEVVEDLDQLRVGDRQGRDVTGEQLVVVLPRSVADSHRRYPSPPGWGRRRMVTS